MRRWTTFPTLLLLFAIPHLISQNKKPEGSITVTGRITDGKDQPVAGARIYAQKYISGDRDDSGQNRLEAASNAAGRFEFKGDLSPGTYWVAMNPGVSEDYYCRPVYFELGDTDVSDLEISVHRGVTLSGTVIPGEGVPKDILLRAKLSFRPKEISKVGQYPVHYKIDREMKKSGQLFSNGAFTIKGVPPFMGKLSFEDQSGTPFINYSILVEHNGQDITQSLNVQEKDLKNIRMLVMAGKGSISGNVQCTSGILDVDRLHISISQLNDEEIYTSKRVQLHANASFRVRGLAPGKYLVTVVYTSQEGMSWILGANHYVDVQNGKVTGIIIPVSEEQTRR